MLSYIIRNAFHDSLYTIGYIRSIVDHYSVAMTSYLMVPITLYSFHESCPFESTVVPIILVKNVYFKYSDIL